jgi:hypothetical protein
MLLDGLCKKSNIDFFLDSKMVHFIIKPKPFKLDKATDREKNMIKLRSHNLGRRVFNFKILFK